MDRIHPSEEIADPFWPPASDPDKMNRTSSEWIFQSFLSQTDPAGLESFVGDSLGEEQLPVLRRQLNAGCNAYAQSKGAPVLKNEENFPLSDEGSPSSDTALMGPSFTGKDKYIATGAASNAILPGIQNQTSNQSKPSGSCSSGEQSDDDEVEAEDETNGLMDPAHLRRVRRMISNRESARRSRRRKQAHLSELEVQVSQLKVENSSLLKSLTDVSKKFNEAAVDNRILKADVETFRAKVKMAEDAVKRVTGVNPFFPTLHRMLPTMMPFTGSPSEAGSPSEVADATVPTAQEIPDVFFQSTDDYILNSPVIDPGNYIQNHRDKMGRSESMHRVASLEHVQKRLRAEGSPCGSLQWDDEYWSPDTSYSVESGLDA